jgi:hypothetical protein
LTPESTEPKTGETDFLRLPEQPDPSAWATIESELRGEASATAADDQSEPATYEAPPVETEVESAEVMAEEAPAEEPAEPAAEEVEEPVAAEAVDVTESEVAEPAAVSPSVERANELLDELRVVIVGLSNTAAPAGEAGPSLADVKPTAEEISQFAVLRAVVDAASERPRDIDTMLDLSSRLDDIKALHDAFTRLAEAVSATDSSGDGQPDQ